MCLAEAVTDLCGIQKLKLKTDVTLVLPEKISVFLLHKLLTFDPVNEGAP